MRSGMPVLRQNNVAEVLREAVYHWHNFVGAWDCQGTTRHEVILHVDHEQNVFDVSHRTQHSLPIRVAEQCTRHIQKICPSTMIEMRRRSNAALIRLATLLLLALTIRHREDHIKERRSRSHLPNPGGIGNRPRDRVSTTSNRYYAPKAGSDDPA
ncbi:hypothetical protein BCAR13_820010 [Paraburkholderia caribensis]|nr:hypothetical protein BCAR13_820010 [Paraburkholderia caribensis]